jgi:hypothetical protein
MNKIQAYDFGQVKDKQVIERAKSLAGVQAKNYQVRLEDVYMAQLMTPETILGDSAEDYLLVRSTFDHMLTIWEASYQTRIQQFEDFHSDLVMTASPETAKKIFDTIECQSDKQERVDASFINIASELFVMEQDQ